MAGTIPGFNADEVRAGLRLAMEIGLPPQGSDQPRFYFPTPVASSGSTDSSGTPLQWDAEPQRSDPPPPVSVPCGIEYGDALGDVAPARLTLTLLDEDYERVKGFAYVVVGGNRYHYKKTEPPMGLVSVGVWTVHVSTDDEG